MCWPPNSGRRKYIPAAGDGPEGRTNSCWPEEISSLKALKVPGKNKEYQCNLGGAYDGTTEAVCAEQWHVCEKNTRKKNIILKPSELLKGYFSSVLPYIGQWEKFVRKKASTKITKPLILPATSLPDPSDWSTHDQMASFIFVDACFLRIFPLTVCTATRN